MAICKFCGAEFSPSSARRYLGHRFYAGIYNEYYEDGDVCLDCALEEIGADWATGQELMELMGDSWDD